MSRNTQLYIGNLPRDIHRDEIYREFEEFGKIREVFGELMTKETMYFYLVDELTGLPVRGDGYPIEITKPSELVPKLLPVMQVGMRAMSLYNGVAGVAQMVGYPAPKVPEGWRKGAQSSVEMLKQVRI